MKMTLLIALALAIGTGGGFLAGRYTARPGFILMSDGSSIENTELHGVTIFIPSGVSGVRIRNNLFVAGASIDERPERIPASTR